MKLLVLNWLDAENPRAGGAEVHLHESFGRLAAKGWEVTVVASGYPGCAPRAEIDGLQIHRVGGRHTYPFLVARYVRRNWPDPAAFDLAIEDLNKVPLFLPIWRRGPTLLLVHHLFGATAFQEATLPVALPTWLLERTVPRVYRGIPVVAVSEGTKADLIYRGMEASRIEVIENGVDLTFYRPAADERRFDEPTILYLGRLKRYKRVDLVLDAVARLIAEGGRARLMIAGRGDHRPALEKKAGALGLGREDVDFLGYVSEEEKRELLQRSWVHVLTSPKEGWGISNLEAAACATPTVASDSPGLRDSVIDGVTGFLVPHGDVSALTDRLRILLEDAELREGLGVAARSFAEGLSWTRSAERLEASCLRAVAEASGRRSGGSSEG